MQIQPIMYSERPSDSIPNTTAAPMAVPHQAQRLPTSLALTAHPPSLSVMTL